LSFFVSRDALDLATLALPDGDPYLVYWTTQLTPLCGRGSVWAEFARANTWVRRFLPQALPASGLGSWTLHVERRPATRAVIGSWLSRALEPWQRRRLPPPLRAAAARGSSEVVLSERVLKFHSHDRRAEYRRRWLQHPALATSAS
jgi:hypothetical protein